MQQDLDARTNFQFAAQRIDRAIDKILFRRFLRELFVSLNLQFNGVAAARAKLQRVVQRYGVKDRAQFVVAVGALSKHVETQIDFRVRWDADFSHAIG